MLKLGKQIWPLNLSDIIFQIYNDFGIQKLVLCCMNTFVFNLRNIMSKYIQLNYKKKWKMSVTFVNSCKKITSVRSFWKSSDSLRFISLKWVVFIEGKHIYLMLQTVQLLWIYLKQKKTLVNYQIILLTSNAVQLNLTVTLFFNPWTLIVLLF